MKIEGPKAPQTVSKTGKTSGASGSTGSTAFSSLLGSGEAGEAQGTAASNSASAVGGVFMLQANSDAERKKRAKAIARGEEVLSLLDQITYALLSHNVSSAHLARLKGLASQSGETISDPRLAAVLDEIDLRLAVEAAKLEMAAESAV